VALGGSLVTVVNAQQLPADAVLLTTYEAYNAAGQVTQQTNSYGQSIVFTYDSAGRRTGASTVISGQTLSVGYSYDDSGRLASITDENGHHSCYDYDGFSRLTTIRQISSGKGNCTNGNDGVVVASYAYHYHDPALGGVLDDPSHVTTTLHTGSSDADQISRTFLDGIGRSIQTSVSAGPNGPVINRTDFDSLGRPYRVWRPIQKSQ
jgi:YD repeat-containing protein